MPASAFARADYDTRACPGTTVELGLSAPNANVVDGGRLCGEQFSSALGLYYLRARFMNAASGRFWSMDRWLGDKDDPSSLHKYLYASADPVNGWDPTGYTTIAETEAAKAESATLSAVSGVRLAFQTGG